MDKTLKQQFEEVANAYLLEFCNKHDFDYAEAKRSWVANKPGGVVLCGDYYVDFDEIRTDIDRDAPEEEFWKYQDYLIDAHTFGFRCPNYENWLDGCPRLSKEQINEIIAGRHRIEKMKEQLEEMIKDYEQGIKL